MITANHKQSFEWEKVTLSYPPCDSIPPLSECVIHEAFTFMAQSESTRKTFSFLPCSASHAMRPSIFPLPSLTRVVCVSFLCWHPSKIKYEESKQNGESAVRVWLERSFRVAREKMLRRSRKLSNCTSYALDDFPAFHQHRQRQRKHW